MILSCFQMWIFSFGQRQDSLKQLTELVHKGDKKGIFSSRMPARIQQVVREENLHFMKNRNVYDTDYFLFIRKLASVNIVRQTFSCCSLYSIIMAKYPKSCIPY